MKGQYLTVEYVMFFAIGIAMIVGVYFAFSNIDMILKDVAVRGQLDRISENLRSSVVEIYLSANNTDSDIIYNMSIPTKVSGSIYSIRNLDNGININSTDNYNIGKVLDLYGIDISMSDIIYSTKGKITISANAAGVVLS